MRRVQAEKIEELKKGFQGAVILPAPSRSSGLGGVFADVLAFLRTCPVFADAGPAPVAGGTFRPIANRGATATPSGRQSSCTPICAELRDPARSAPCDRRHIRPERAGLHSRSRRERP